MKLAARGGKEGRPPRKPFEDAFPAVIASVGAGFPLERAAERADVPSATVKSWLTRGRREPGSKFAAFTRAYEEARASEVEEPMDALSSRCIWQSPSVRATRTP